MKKTRRRILLIIIAVLLFNFVVPPYFQPARGTITSRYFVRKKPEVLLPVAFELHRGMDIANIYGTPVRTTKSGRIGETGYDPGYGNYIIIKHFFGFSSYYGHLSDVSVRKRQIVIKGKVIGKMGSSGRSTGPHLHFEIRWRNRSLPPNVFLIFSSVKQLGLTLINRTVSLFF